MLGFIRVLTALVFAFSGTMKMLWWGHPRMQETTLYAWVEGTDWLIPVLGFAEVTFGMAIAFRCVNRHLLILAGLALLGAAGAAAFSEPERECGCFGAVETGLAASAALTIVRAVVVSLALAVLWWASAPHPSRLTG